MGAVAFEATRLRSDFRFRRLVLSHYKVSYRGNVPMLRIGLYPIAHRDRSGVVSTTLVICALFRTSRRSLKPRKTETMSSIPSLHALLGDELKDLFHAENQLIKALPKMVKAATNPDLKAGFTAHLKETHHHVARLMEALKALGLPPKGKPCHAMLGLIEEGAEAIEMEGPAAVRDAALIGAAQRVEHYEIAGYGTARAFAQALEKKQIVKLLQETLDEESATNEKLTKLSDTVNADALASSERKAETETANK